MWLFRRELSLEQQELALQKTLAAKYKKSIDEFVSIIKSEDYLQIHFWRANDIKHSYYIRDSDYKPYDSWTSVIDWVLWVNNVCVKIRLENEGRIYSIQLDNLSTFWMLSGELAVDVAKYAIKKFCQQLKIEFDKIAELEELKKIEEANAKYRERIQLISEEISNLDRGWKSTDKYVEKFFSKLKQLDDLWEEQKILANKIKLNHKRYSELRTELYGMALDGN